MQYFKPEGLFFAGDPMPFFHDGVFHLFWLLDENHHKGKGGLGGHQWAH
jgi:beta-fructofuranosidase